MPLHDAQFTSEGWFDPYSPGRAGGWFDSELIEVAAATGIIEADGSASGTTTVSGVSGATAGSPGSAAGVGTPAGAGAALWLTAGGSDGVAAASGISGALWSVIGSSEGIAAVLGDGEDAAGPAGPAPAGTVPVRYLIGQIPNVVPVETVLTSEAGVVPVREFVGPANVVPVRETATETPRVKVRKV